MPPFVLIPLEVLADDRLSHRQLRVLLALYSFKHKDADEVWPKRQTLAARCGLPLTRISQVTTELQGLGWLTKVGAGGCSCPTHYTLTIPEILKAEVMDPERETTPIQVETVTETVTVTELVTVTETVTPTVTKTVTGKEQTIEHKEVCNARAREGDVSQEEDAADLILSPSQAKGGDWPGFADFWVAYPRKKAKEDARRAWNRLQPASALQAVIQADLTQRPRHDDTWRRGFIPYPATYLNGQRWEDEYTQTQEVPHARHRESAAERFERLNNATIADLIEAGSPATPERVIYGEVIPSPASGVRRAVVIPISDARGHGGGKARMVGQGV